MKNLPSQKVKELNIEFPPAPKPAGVYRPVLVVDKFLFVSGQGPVKNDGTLMQGRLGDNLTSEEGKLAARQVGLTMLSSIQTHFGSLDKIKDIFGDDQGIGVRSAVGMILPGGIPVEIEAMFELY